MRSMPVFAWIKVVSRVLAGLAVVSLAACGGGGGSTASTDGGSGGGGGGGGSTVTTSSITLPTSVEVVSAK